VQEQMMTGRATVGLLRLPAVRPGPGGQLTRCIGFSKAVAVPMRRRELPSRHVTLMISFGDHLAIVGDDDGRRNVGSFVSGLQSESVVTERVGHQHGMHVELNPLAAYSLFGLPMHSMTNALVDLPAVLGGGSAELVERLAGARSWPQRFALLRAALAVRMTRGPEPTAAVGWAWHRLRATNGSVRIAELVQQSGFSHRHLVARFREEVGMTPKSLARVLRFEHSLTLLRQTGTPLADVAAAAGYYDQAHLNRDFRALAGFAPGQFSPRPSA
jgi:AraC-like DNA-binding protein